MPFRRSARRVLDPVVEFLRIEAVGGAVLLAATIAALALANSPLADTYSAAGVRWYESQVLRTLALTSTLQGRHQQAEGELRECLDVALELGDLAGVAMDLDRLGQAAVALGHPERAVVLAAAADRLRESVGGGLTVESGRWATEHPRDAARRLLTDSEIDRAWAQGRTMGLEDAVAYVRTA